LETIIHSKTEHMSMKELSDLLLELKCPAGPINTIEKILEDDYTKFHNLIMSVNDKSEGNFKVIGSPLKFEKFDIPTRSFVSQPGEYSAEVLTNILGVSEEQMLSLGCGYKKVLQLE